MATLDGAVDEYNPMPDLMDIVKAAAPELEKVVIGAFPGNQSQKGQQPPFVFLRSAGGPEPDAQDTEVERRLDVTVFAKSEAEANRISNRIHRFIRLRRHEEKQLEYEAQGAADPDSVIEVKLPSLFSAGGPLDILDDDVKLPGVFRSYYLIYSEDAVDDCA